MGDVIGFDRAKGKDETWLSGPAICTECHHEWCAALEIKHEMDPELIECPNCRKFFGVMRGPQVPDTMFRCNCGSNLFYLQPEGHQCRSCGNVSLDWANG